MGIFDHEPPVLASSTRNYGEELMAAHAADNPGFTGPEIPQSGNRYSLPDADGRIVIWNGATTLAAELDNPYALQQWQLRQTVWGLGQRPDLVAQAAVATIEDKDLLRQVVRDAQSAAAIDSGANMGKALHMAFERVDRGEPIENLPEMFHADIKARQEMLAFHGVTILPEYVERVVRCAIFKVAGRLDRIGRLSDGSLVIIDDKSERDPVKYPHSKCVQLGVYANAGELMDYTRNQLEPMPNVRKDFALVIHSRPGQGACEIFRVDIARGWAAAYIAVQLREWRKADGLIAPYLSTANWVPADFYAPEQATEVEQHAASNGSAPSDDVIEANVETIISALAQLDDPQDNTDPQQLIATIKEAQEKVTEVVKEEPPAKPSWQEPDSPAQPISNPAIDPMTEAEELIARYATKPGKKKELWQELCRSVGITDLNRHIVGRNGLALAYVNKRNELGMTEVQAEVMRAAGQRIEPKQDHYGRNLDGSPSDATYEGSEQQLRDAEVSEDIRAENPAMTLESVLAEIEVASSKQDLADIWKRFTDEYGEAAWTGQLAKAGMDRLRVIENQRPVASDNPFA